MTVREVRAVVGVDAAVVAVGLREVHLLEVDQLGAAAGDDRDPPRRRARSPAARSRSRSTHAREPLGVDRLQQVVERLDRERLDRVLGVRGHEDDGRRRRSRPGRARAASSPVRPGHLDVEEDRVVASRRATRASASAAPAASSAATSSCAPSRCSSSERAGASSSTTSTRISARPRRSIAGAAAACGRIDAQFGALPLQTRDDFAGRLDRIGAGGG